MLPFAEAVAVWLLFQPTPPPLPEAHELDRFPGKATTRAVVEFQRDLRRYLQTQALVYPSRSEYQDALAELEDAMAAWELLWGCYELAYNRNQRESLGLLRGRLGENFYWGQMPEPWPAWVMREM